MGSLSPFLLKHDIFECVVVLFLFAIESPMLRLIQVLASFMLITTTKNVTVILGIACDIFIEAFKIGEPLLRFTRNRCLQVYEVDVVQNDFRWFCLDDFVRCNDPLADG